MKDNSEYTSGRLSVIQEMMEWVSVQLQKHPPGSGEDGNANKVISGVRRAHNRTFQKLMEKESKTLKNSQL